MAAKKKTAAKKTAKKTATPKSPGKKMPEPKVAKKRSTQPTSGQSGPPLELTKERLNSKEEKIVTYLSGEANPVTIIALASICFGDQLTSKANSWVRNSLRRLVRAKWVEKVGQGTYRLTEMGHSRYTTGTPVTFIETAALPA